MANKSLIAGVGLPLSTPRHVLSTGFDVGHVGGQQGRTTVALISANVTHIRGNILATSISSDASNASTKPDDMDDLDAPARIYTFCTRLRALSGVSRVVVRVHSGA